MPVELLLEALLVALVELMGEVVAVLGLELLGQKLCVLAGELAPEVIEQLAEGIWGALGDRRKAHVACSVPALGFLGAVCGAFTLALRPAAVLPPFVNPVLVLVGAPLVVGASMEVYGRWRSASGATVSHLASFWGGGAFALGWVVVRVWAHTGAPF